MPPSISSLRTDFQPTMSCPNYTVIWSAFLHLVHNDIMRGLDTCPAEVHTHVECSWLLPPSTIPVRGDEANLTLLQTRHALWWLQGFAPVLFSVQVFHPTSAACLFPLLRYHLLRETFSQLLPCFPHLQYPLALDVSFIYFYCWNLKKFNWIIVDL